MPLANGALGRIDVSDAAPLLLCGGEQRGLLARRPELLIELDPEEPLGRTLARIGATGQTNVQTFSAAALPKLLPMLQHCRQQLKDARLPLPCSRLRGWRRPDEPRVSGTQVLHEVGGAHEVSSDALEEQETRGEQHVGQRAFG